MKIVLEKHDLLAIVEKHFNEKFDRARVVIRADPFEVELSGIPLEAATPEAGETPAAAATPLTVVEDTKETPTEDDLHTQLALQDGATLDAPPPGMDDVEPGDARDASPASLVAASRALEAELEKNAPPKQRRGGTSKDPGNFKEEM